MNGRISTDAGSAGPGIKICGLFRECDISYVNRAQPDYAGFILNFPKSHRNVSPAAARILRQLLRPEIRAVGVFVNQPADTVMEIAELVGLDVIQLHGQEDNAYIKKIREQSGLTVWKAFKVRDAEDLDKARQCAADEVLLDNGYGTGEAFDWSVVTGSRGGVPKRGFILAGGLTPDNLPDALRRLGPGIVDISSGVETDKVKDPDKIMAAVRAVRDFAQSAATREEA